MSANTSITSENYITPERKFLLVQIHATCFIFAWFFVTIVAFLSARYLRQLLPNYKLFGSLIWFHIHRSLNLIAIILMITGLLAIFIAYEWTWNGPKPNGTKNLSSGAIHSLFGILACTCAFFQPFVALFRCAPTHPRRNKFNIIHRSLGIIAWSFAMTCLGIACFYFKKRLISTEIAFSLYSFNILSVLITVLGFEYYLSYRQKQKQSKENGKFSNRRMSPVPLANCLTVGILGMVTLTVSTLICILVWAK